MRKEFDPNWGELFPLRIDLFSVGNRRTRKHTGSYIGKEVTKSCLPCLNGGNLPSAASSNNKKRLA